MPERVLVVRRNAFFGGHWPQGFVPWTQPEAAALVASFEQEAFFVDREEAEREPAWKQLIPYCAVERSGPVRALFCVRRSRRQSESRLHDLWSIGLGGHVNPDDGEERTAGILERALRRELQEELVLREAPAPVPLGLINDDAGDVGRVHAGLAYLLRVPAGTRVTVRERAKMTGGFRPLPSGDPGRGHVAGSESLWQDPAHFESWSQFLLEVLIRPHPSNSDQAALEPGT